jgi:hypothetical protein
MVNGRSTGYEFIGELPALGGIHLTKLAKSFEELAPSPLDFLFPDEINNERTIVIETIMEGLGTAPIVQFGRPAGAFMHNERILRRTVEPVVIREDDFLDQGMINQLRKPGEDNVAYSPTEIIERRVGRLMRRQQRTKALLQSLVLQGGINYTDPRTNVSTNVSTQIPAHNLFRYDGWDATVASGAALALGFNADKALTNNKNRREALMFVNPTTMTAGVPWTNERCDVVRCIRYISQYLYNTNKNRYTDAFMSRDLYTILLENQYVKAAMGQVGIFLSSTGSVSAGSANASTPSSFYSFDAAGNITHIAGLMIHLMDSMYRDPEDGDIKKMWPSNLVAMVARNHVQDKTQTLGYTQHCVAESPDGNPGVWFRTSPDMMPPNPPGRAMQMGNAFMPYAMYPQWISLLEVCEPGDVDESLVFSSDLSYGTF